MYLFGGEYATADQFYHFRDLWVLDLKTHTWREITATGDCPSGRSGHRMVVWRSYLILFGGFYEAMRDVRWFGDLYLFSLAEERWVAMPIKPNAPAPRPRSGMMLCLHPSEDALYMMGGYSKETSAAAGSGAGTGAPSKEGKVHEDMWLLPLKPALPTKGTSSSGAMGGLDVSKLTWQKVSRKGDFPSKRSGAVLTVYKNKAIAFGGVHDIEGTGHSLCSTFYNSLHAFDLDRRRWYQLGLKLLKTSSAAAAAVPAAAKALAGTAAGAAGDSDSDDAEDDAPAVKEEEQPEEDVFGYIDEHGNVIYMKLDKDEEEVEGEVVGKLEAVTLSLPVLSTAVVEAEAVLPVPVAPVAPVAVAPLPAPVPVPVPASPAAAAPSAVSSSWMSFLCQRTEPCPRINPCIMLRGNGTLVIYGGVTEIGDVEVTLDDCWSLDLNKRDHWKCILPGTMHTMVWKGIDDDDDSSRHTGLESGSDSDSDSDGSDEDAEDDEEEDAPKQAKAPEGHGLRAEMESLRVQFAVTDTNRTPLSGEALRAFYSRTADYWAAQVIAAWQQADNKQQTAASAAAVGVLSEKEIKKQGFQLAEVRYNELLPILTRLNELEQQQLLEEAERGGGGRGGRPGGSGGGKMDGRKGKR